MCISELWVLWVNTGSATNGLKMRPATPEFSTGICLEVWSLMKNSSENPCSFKVRCFLCCLCSTLIWRDSSVALFDLLGLALKIYPKYSPVPRTELAQKDPPRQAKPVPASPSKAAACRARAWGISPEKYAWRGIAGDLPTLMCWSITATYCWKPIYIYIYWLVVSTPLRNISQSGWLIIPNIWKNKGHVPNHQPE